METDGGRERVTVHDPERQGQATMIPTAQTGAERFRVEFLLLCSCPQRNEGLKGRDTVAKSSGSCTEYTAREERARVKADKGKFT